MDETTPVPELINEMPADMDGMPIPELYMEMEGAPMDDYYNTAPMTGGEVAMFAGMMGVWTIVMFGFMIIMIVSFWKIFTKAGEKGWKSLIPFYNTWVLLEVSGKPGWWLFLMFIPFVNIVIIILMYIALSKSFGKGIGYTLGFLFLPWLFFPMLAFGKATHAKPVDGDSGTNTPPQQQTPPQTPPQNPTV